MHIQARKYVEQAVKQHGPFTGAVAEIGSQDVNGTIRDLFSKASSYVGIDIMPGPHVDVVIDAADWRPERKFCCIVSTETFEHTPRWPEILQVAAAALEPTGALIITCASNPRKPHSAHTHRARVVAGEYYGNVSRRDFQAAAQAAGLQADIKVDYERGDLYACCRLRQGS